MKRILVTGSRDWPDHLAVWGTLDGVMREFDLNCEPDEYGNTLPDPMKVAVVHGGCPTGADLFADDWCNNQLILPEVYKADWKRLGNRAGPIRNKMMVNTLVPGRDLCLAFILNASVGATLTLHWAKKAGIETRVHSMWTRSKPFCSDDECICTKNDTAPCPEFFRHPEDQDQYRCCRCGWLEMDHERRGT